MADPVGVAVAFGGDALDETPTWTRLDTTAGVAVQSWSSRRGRAYLSDRTDAGTATIGFSDQVGALDPTNTAGLFYPMDPNCPAAICLQHAVTGAWSTVYRGQIQEVPITLLDGARRHTGSLPLVDMFALLAIREVLPGLDFDDTDAGTSTSNITGNCTYAYQTVQDRMKAILADSGVPAGLTNIFSGNVHVQPTVYAPGYKILAALQDAADAEFPGIANLFMSKDGIVSFRGRFARFNPADVHYDINTWHTGDQGASAADTGMAVVSGLKVNRDVAKVINNALFTPRGIGTADIAGQLVTDGGSITKYGSRSLTGQDLLTADGISSGLNANDETKSFGAFYVANFADAQTRVQQAVFRWLHPSHPNATAHWNFLCGVEISDIVEITTTHLASGGFLSERYFVEGISYNAQLGPRSIWDITMTLDLSPADYYTTEPSEWNDPH